MTSVEERGKRGNRDGWEKEKSWEMEEQVEMYQRNRRVWRQQWKERGWKVFGS